MKIMTYLFIQLLASLRFWSCCLNEMYIDGFFKQKIHDIKTFFSCE